MDTDAAVSYFLEVLGDLVLPIEELMSEIAHAPFPLKQNLRKHIRNDHDLIELLTGHDQSFIVENRQVAALDPALENGREKAVPYFENVLKLYYDENPFYMNLRGHIGQADSDVIDFIGTFYHGVEFKNFLLSHPDVFVVFGDDTVALIENISVDYFEDWLDTYEEGAYINHLRGHIGQAPTHVIDYINTYYPGNRFSEFLDNNPDVFRIEGDYVYLNEEHGD